jgi:hypothetical protein
LVDSGVFPAVDVYHLPVQGVPGSLDGRSILYAGEFAPRVLKEGLDWKLATFKPKNGTPLLSTLVEPTLYLDVNRDGLLGPEDSPAGIPRLEENGGTLVFDSIDANAASSPFLRYFVRWRALRVRKALRLWPSTGQSSLTSSAMTLSTSLAYRTSELMRRA